MTSPNRFYEILEKRRHYAVNIAPVSHSSSLYIWGSNKRDIIYVEQKSKLLYVVDASSGKRKASFRASAIKRIYIDGLAGNDTIVLDYAKRGFVPVSVRTYIDAGIGTDFIAGGSGPDSITGDVGDDSLFGQGGNDTIDGGDGDDVIGGGDGADSIHGETGDDHIAGGNGSTVSDNLNDGNDTIFGDDGNDYIHGDNGSNVIDGGAGDDIIYAEIDLSTFEDTTWNGKSYPSTLLGGDGDDTLHGGSGDDIINGGNGSDWIAGNSGDDDINGGQTSDVAANSQDGNDTIYGGPGNDYILGANGSNFISGDTGNDTIYAQLDTHPTAFSSPTTIVGGPGDDVTYGNDEDTIFGGGGADSLDGGGGDDFIAGNGGADTITGGYGDDGIADDSRTATIYLQEGYDRWYDRSGGSNNLPQDFTNGQDVSFDLIENAASFSSKELSQIDKGLAWLSSYSVNLLKSSTGSELSLERVKNLGSGPTDGLTVADNVSSQTIQFADLAFTNQSQPVDETAVHEFGHNWDSENPNWQDWLNISGWRSITRGATPDAGYVIGSSGGSDPSNSSIVWEHSSTAVFIKGQEEAMQNPYEDFAVSFGVYYIDKQPYGNYPLRQSTAAWRAKADFIANFLSLETT